MSALREVLDLEKDGPCPKDFSKVDRVHQQLLELGEKTPAYFRVENPDERFDSLPECYWIKYIRATLPQLLYFNLMALHRPYIFTRPKSRTEALKASLAMLHAQRVHFQSIKPEHYKTCVITNQQPLSLNKPNEKLMSVDSPCSLVLSMLSF
jgi:hypothetical protein